MKTPKQHIRVLGPLERPPAALLLLLELLLLLLLLLPKLRLVAVLLCLPPRGLA